MDAIAGFPIHRGILAFGERGTRADSLRAADRLPARACRRPVRRLQPRQHGRHLPQRRRLRRRRRADRRRHAATRSTARRSGFRWAARWSCRSPASRPRRTPSTCWARAASKRSPSARRRTTCLTSVRPSARTALLLGAEGHGLPPEAFSRARGVSIPMAGDFDSLERGGVEWDRAASFAVFAIRRYPNGAGSEPRP